MRRTHWDDVTDSRRKYVSSVRVALWAAMDLLLIGACGLLIVGTSLEGLWLNQVAAADDGGGSTVPIPPPDRPPPQVTDSTPLETHTPTGEPITPTLAEIPYRESSSETSAALWFGIGLGAVSLVGLASGAFVLVSSQRPRRGA